MQVPKPAALSPAKSQLGLLLCVFVVGALTTMSAAAIFAAMRGIAPLAWFVRALALALTGLVIASGTALAHGVLTAHSDQPSVGSDRVTEPQRAHHAAPQAVDTENWQEAAVLADSGNAPCSDEPSSGHFAGGCCNVACHAALTAPALESASAPYFPSQYRVSLSDMLVGRLGDRTERPPKGG